MVLRFTNFGDKTLHLVTKDGKPSLVVQPVKPSADPPSRSQESADRESQRYYGRQQYLAPAGDWVQDRATAKRLADALITAGAFPVPVLSDVEVLYDPRIQLGDVVRVQDSAGAELDTLAWVVGIRTEAAAGTITQTLTLRGTCPNGMPMGYWLAADPPVDPEAGRRRTYAEVVSGWPVLARLAGLTYRAVKEYS
ncbi:hypothetical protein ACSNOK_15560 [Streptomyces sp. URMC 126]|uniref:hypothetical protein n=1 Tax=Streptomyces sp. URMC 126 TaxID=3423401 RepID=UPI003F1AAD81